MRKREYQIKVRLSQEEYNHLNAQVAETVCSREAFIRAALENKTVVEMPKDYRLFIKEMHHISTQLQLMNWNAALAPQEQQKLYALGQEVQRTIHRLNEAYLRLEKKEGRT